jgi:hypothetical protein
MPGQPFRAGVIARWVLNERFQVDLPPFPGFAWRTENDKQANQRDQSCHYKYAGLN